MKTDLNLGLEVKNYLTELGIETPMKKSILLNTKEKQRVLIEDSFKTIMTALGLDLSDDSLKDTPKRVAKMYVDEIFNGLDYANFPKATTVENKMNYDEMIVVSDIDVSSSCEHHFVNIDGVAKISYIPNKKVLGLSKINRIVKFFSKRPQIQERLTEQVSAALRYILDTEDVAVEIVAVHYCVKARGVEDKNSYTTTRKLSGLFHEKAETRNEFLNTK